MSVHGEFGRMGGGVWLCIYGWDSVCCHIDLEVSALLDIGTATLWRWKARCREGRLVSTYPKVRSAYKLDETSMLSYLDEHPDAYLHEIARVIAPI